MIKPIEFDFPAQAKLVAEIRLQWRIGSNTSCQKRNKVYIYGIWDVFGNSGMTEMVIFFRLFIYKWMKTVGKLFIKEFGLSPQEYVQQRKLSERGIINNGQHGA